MIKLSKQEERILDSLLTMKASAAAIRLKITTHNINVVKSNVRRKEASARKFLKDLKKYERIIHPKPRYKGI